jgi:hypothetical protein
MGSELNRSGSASSKISRAGVLGASQEIGTWARPRWQHTSGYQVPEKNKEGLVRVLRPQMQSQHETKHVGGREERKEREKGWHGHYSLPASSSSDPSWAPDAHRRRHVW